MKPNRVALVTGASSGIGRAIATHLSANDYTVYGTYFNTDAPLEGVTHSQVDVSDNKQVHEWVQSIIRKEGLIDILVNCAGIHVAGATEYLSNEELQRLFDVNFFGVVNTTRAVLPTMRKAGFGHIINVSSIGGRIGLPYQGGYCATKFAVEGYTDAIRHEVSRFGIRVSIIEPGDFATSITFNRKVNPQTYACPEYAVHFNRVLDIIARDEQSGPKPEQAARRVLYILQQSYPGLRYSTGLLSQRLALFLSRLLPGAMFRSLIATKYCMK